MKLYTKILFAFLLCFQMSFSQENQDATVLKVVLTKYYQNEKVIVKNRLQYLSIYCKKAPNNEETFSIINGNEILKKFEKVIKSQVKPSLNEDWSKELATIFNNQNQYLKSKVNDCLSLDEFQKISTKQNENNQRLLIVSKPIYFGAKYCLVKIAFYKNIEHNSGCFLLLENIKNVWTVKETLNEWAT